MPISIPCGYYITTVIAADHYRISIQEDHHDISDIYKNPAALYPKTPVLYPGTGDDVYHLFLLSASLSYKVTYKAVSIADQALDLELTDQQVSRCIRKIHYYVRKLAHFTEYFLLAITVAFPLYVYGIRGIWLVITGGILCVGFAALDELHQHFVSGRSCSVRDVVIDSCGALIGILFVRIIGYIGRKTVFEPLSTHRS